MELSKDHELELCTEHYETERRAPYPEVKKQVLKVNPKQ